MKMYIYGRLDQHYRDYGEFNRPPSFIPPEPITKIQKEEKTMKHMMYHLTSPDISSPDEDVTFIVTLHQDFGPLEPEDWLKIEGVSKILADILIVGQYCIIVSPLYAPQDVWNSLKHKCDDLLAEMIAEGFDDSEIVPFTPTPSKDEWLEVFREIERDLDDAKAEQQGGDLQ